MLGTTEVGARNNKLANTFIYDAYLYHNCKST